MTGATPRLLACLSLASVFLAAGCGRKPLPMNDKVEGTVKLNGVPLPRVQVQFIPVVEAGQKAPSSSAVTDDKGHFSLNSEAGKPGAVVAKHRVVVVAGRGGQGGDRDAPDRPAPRAMIPQPYTIAAQTPLQVEVTADKHSYELALNSNAQPAP
jgi:hypothetical protein